MRLFSMWCLHVAGPTRRILFGFIFLSFATVVSAQPDDRRVESIRRLSTQINEQIAESERVEESNGIYCNELVINKGDKSWPAVGIYRVVTKFHYTFGDREKDPYPNRLLKISVTTNRSDRQEYEEYFFNGAGQLVFYFEKESEDAQSERRFYFASGRLVRQMTGARTIDSNSGRALAKQVATRTLALRKMFSASLEN